MSSKYIMQRDEISHVAEEVTANLQYSSNIEL